MLFIVRQTMEAGRLSKELPKEMLLPLQTLNYPRVRNTLIQ